MGTGEHWQHTYLNRDATRVGWYESAPEASMRLVMAAVAGGARSVIDVGGGAASLVDRLLDEGLDRLAVLDISSAGIDIARARLGRRAAEVEWIVGDVTTLDGLGRFDVWHDRAVFHFLLEPVARARYVAQSERTVEPGSLGVIPSTPAR